MRTNSIFAVARRERRRGFTLVELLVVIAVLATLLGILLPAYTGVMREYMRHACRGNLEQIGKGLMLYGPSAMNRGSGGSNSLPALTDPLQDANNKAAWHLWTVGQGNTNSLWLLVSNNFAEPDNFVCPEARRALGHKPARFNRTDSDTRFTWNTCSYSYISQVGYWYNKTPSATPAIPDTYVPGGSSLVTIDTRTKKVLLGDRNPRMAENSKTYVADSLGINSKNHNSEGQNFFLLNQQVLWTEDLGSSVNGMKTTMNDTRLDDDPYSPVTATDFTLGIPSNSMDSFLLQ